MTRNEVQAIAELAHEWLIEASEIEFDTPELRAWQQDVRLRALDLLDRLAEVSGMMVSPNGTAAPLVAEMPREEKYGK